ncbi:MAG: VWA domain-containing protein, partial [Candidatus Competibacteraceae bacterium]|nr:VWA domain-containing protein [Candidatus Competibacteraceae bacterium]
MLQFAWPYLLLILPLPLLARWLPPAAQQPSAGLRLPFYTALATQHTPTRSGRGRRALAWLIWLLLVLAACRPQWLGEPVQLPLSGRDLVLAVDISGSMNTADMELSGRHVTRLRAVKTIAGEFISRRQGDRIGLILFGSQAYMQAPLTFDLKTVRTLLDEAEIGLAGKETAIGDAIALTLKRLRDLTVTDRVLVLLTDGANNTGVISPARAADLAAQQNLRIYTIGVGAEEMITQGIFGTTRVNPSADLDEDTLRQIADETGGRYFRARDTRELERIYALLDELEPLEADTESFRPVDELYPWPLAMVLLLTALLVWAPLL